MTAVVFLPSCPDSRAMGELRSIMQKFPHVWRKCSTKDGIYIFLENNTELFEHLKIKESAKLSAREELDNPSRRKKHE